MRKSATFSSLFRRSFALIKLIFVCWYFLHLRFFLDFFLLHSTLILLFSLLLAYFHIFRFILMLYFNMLSFLILFSFFFCFSFAERFFLLLLTLDIRDSELSNYIFMILMIELLWWGSSFLEKNVRLYWIEEIYLLNVIGKGLVI